MAPQASKAIGAEMLAEAAADRTITHRSMGCSIVISGPRH